MGIIDKLKQRIQGIAIKSASDDDIQIEAFIRGKGGENLPESEKLTKEAITLSKQTLTKWKNAVAMATDAQAPDYTSLVDLYNNMKLDAHLMSVISSRVLRVQQSNFKLVDANGNEDEEKTSLLESGWFLDWMEAVLMVNYTGAAVIEIWETTEETSLADITVLPKQNINFLKKLILKEAGASTGMPYAEGNLEPYYMQIGKPYELGLFAEIAPLVLAKKLAMGSWLDFIEKFGVPPRWVTTDRQDNTRKKELFDMMIAMISNQVAVLTGNEKIEISQTPNTDAYKVFDQLIERINSEISKRILGATGTTDENSFVGSTKVHQDVANDRHEHDKVLIKNLINNVLIPKLLKFSSYYAPLANLKFEWDYTEEMSQEKLIESVAKLGNYYEFDAAELARITGLPIIGNKNTNTPAGGVGEKK